MLESSVIEKGGGSGWGEEIKHLIPISWAKRARLTEHENKKDLDVTPFELQWGLVEDWAMGKSESRVKEQEGLNSWKSSYLVFVLKGLITSLLEKTRVDKGFCRSKGVTIGGRTAVFKVTLLLLANSPGNTDAGAMVGCVSRTVVDTGGFMESSQALGIAFVLKLVWQLALYQFPGVGLESKVAITPDSSCTLRKMKWATQRLPTETLSQGPVRNSHWAGRTSAFIPITLTLVYKQAQ